MCYDLQKRANPLSVLGLDERMFLSEAQRKLRAEQEARNELIQNSKQQGRREAEIKFHSDIVNLRKEFEETMTRRELAIREDLAKTRDHLSSTEASHLQQVEQLTSKLQAHRPRAHRLEAACKAVTAAVVTCYRDNPGMEHRCQPTVSTMLKCAQASVKPHDKT